MKILKNCIKKSILCPKFEITSQKAFKENELKVSKWAKINKYFDKKCSKFTIFNTVPFTSQKDVDKNGLKLSKWVKINNILTKNAQN